MQAALVLNDLWSAVEEDAVYIALEAAARNIMNLKAIALMQVKISSELKHLIKGANGNTAKVAWETLQRTFKA